MIFKYELPSTELIVVEKNNCLKFGEYLNDMQCDDTENKLFINDLEYVKRLKIQISAREEEYKKLEDNWNKLKEWLEKEILDKKEKEYLSAVIRPFRNRVEYIQKKDIGNEFIEIELDDEFLYLPYFEKYTMYKGMELNKKYTLKELDLDE